MVRFLAFIPHSSVFFACFSAAEIVQNQLVKSQIFFRLQARERRQPSQTPLLSPGPSTAVEGRHIVPLQPPTRSRRLPRRPLLSKELPKLKMAV